jgi:hypothetical protein
VAEVGVLNAATEHNRKLADLHVPGALFSTPDHPQSGKLKVTLTAQKADIAPIKLPAELSLKPFRKRYTF